MALFELYLEPLSAIGSSRHSDMITLGWCYHERSARTRIAMISEQRGVEDHARAHVLLACMMYTRSPSQGRTAAPMTKRWSGNRAARGGDCGEYNPRMNRGLPTVYRAAGVEYVRAHQHPPSSERRQPSSCVVRRLASGCVGESALRVSPASVNGWVASATTVARLCSAAAALC